MSATPLSIGVCINSFNRLDLLKECLSGLRRWIDNTHGILVHTFVFDPGSTDGSLAYLRDLELSSSRFTVLTPAHAGETSIAHGFNECAKAAICPKYGCDFLLFYETDNVISSADAVLSALSLLRERKPLAACGFTARRHDGTFAGYAARFPRLLPFAAGFKLTRYLKLDEVPLTWENTPFGRFSYADVVFTSPLLVKAAAWKASDGMDATAFPFSDCDFDWARRVQASGWSMGVVERSDVIHDNRDALSQWSGKRDLHFHRARLAYFRRYHSKSVYLVWPLVLMVRHIAEAFASCFLLDAAKRERYFGRSITLLMLCLHDYRESK